MPNYTYEGRNNKGKRVKGHEMAPDKSTLYQRLKTDGILTFSIEEAVESGKNYKFKIREITEFSRQLSNMLSAGISILKAISILENQMPGKRTKEVLNRMMSFIRQGNTLTEAMERTGAFPDFLIRMYVAGESGGSLESTAKKAAEYYEKERKIKNSIVSAMMYPAFLMLVTLIVTIFIFTSIIPEFEAIFEEMELPLITQMVMGTSDFLIHSGVYLLLGVLIAFAVIQYVCRLPKVAKALSKMLLKVPLIGKLMLTIYTARFARTLSILYTSGLSMLEATSCSAEVIGNRYISTLFPGVLRKIREGNTLSRALIDQKVPMNVKLSSAITIGEETGRLGEVLNITSDGLDYDSEMAIARMLALIEPIMIVLMALVIGTIVLSVMIPMLGMYSAIG